MKFAPTLPVELYKHLDTGDYHMVQAHHLMGATMEAWRWFKSEARMNGHVLMLDCGTFELGKPDIQSLYTVAEELLPNEIVCPDAFRNSGETIELFRMNSRSLSKFCERLMIVPQADSVEDWCSCLDHMLMLSSELSSRPSIGVPKVLDTFAGGRYSALCYMEDKGIGYTYDVHLLGVWEYTGQAWGLQKSMPWIRGMDTTWPFAAAADGLVGDGSKPTMKEEYWKIGPRSRSTIMRSKVNIALWRKELK